MDDAAQQRTLAELRQELLWLRDLVEMALRRFGCEDADAQPLPMPAPLLPVAVPAQESAGPEVLVDVDVIAARLGITPPIIRRYVKNNALPFRRLGNSARPRLRFYVTEVEAWMDGAALKVIENGVTLASGQSDTVVPIASRKGQRIKRSPHLKRRLSYTA